MNSILPWYIDEFGWVSLDVYTVYVGDYITTLLLEQCHILELQGLHMYNITLTE